MPPTTSQASRLPTIIPLALTIALAIISSSPAAAIPAVAAASPCYYADGQIIEDGKAWVRPCMWTQDAINGMEVYNDGTCCTRGHGCLSNGLCIDRGSMDVYQGGCVSRNGDHCWQKCGATDKMEILEKCPMIGTDMFTCPGKMYECKRDRGQNFEIKDFSILGTVIDERLTGQISTIENNSTESSTTTSTTTTTTTDDSLPTMTTTGSSETVTETLPADEPHGPLSSLPSSDKQQATDQHHDGDPSGIVPLAVGASIGGVALVVIVLGGWWWHRDKVRREPARAETPPQTTGPIAELRDFSFLPESAEGYGRMRGF